MPKRTVIAVIVAVVVLLLAVLLAQYFRGIAGDTDPTPVPDNTAGPAEGGALETGGALDSDAGFRNLPARDMPNTISEYPPTGPETDNPPPSRNRGAPSPADGAR